MGRRDAVEVPRRRIGRAVGRAAASARSRRRRYANPRYGPDGLALLREGLAREEVVERLTAGRRRARAPAARRRRRRRAAAPGTPARSAIDWAGGRTGTCYAAQGNILVSEETVDALAETFEASAGGRSRSG